jgi:hypothetical protein
MLQFLSQFSFFLPKIFLESFSMSKNNITIFVEPASTPYHTNRLLTTTVSTVASGEHSSKCGSN